MKIDKEDLKLIAGILSNDFDFYRNQRIFITGGTGFFGKWLLESIVYLNENHQLNLSATVLTRSSEKFRDVAPWFFNHDYINFIDGDVRNFKCENVEFDYIIHAATDASVSLNKSNPGLMRSTIMDGAKRICEFAKEVNCKRILFTSSGAAYGPQPTSMSHMPESFVNNPRFNKDDAYASAKLESEAYFKKNACCDVVIARCFAFSGPYLPLTGAYAFGNFISDVVNNRSIVIKGDGKAVRSYLYAADLIIWLMRILSSGKNGSIYNVGSNESISIGELAHRVCLGKVDTVILGKSDGNKNVYVPCINKAMNELDLKIYTSLESSISKTLHFEGFNN